MNRNESRVIIMTILYQIYIYQSKDIEFDVDKIISENLSIENEFVSTCVKGTLDNSEEIDALANKYLKDWTINRLGYADQAILRMGIYEMKYTDTPAIVCINEAVELAKKYSDDKIKNMINGVLDSVYHEL